MKWGTLKYSHALWTQWWPDHSEKHCHHGPGHGACTNEKIESTKITGQHVLTCLCFVHELSRAVDGWLLNRMEHVKWKITLISSIFEILSQKWHHCGQYASATMGLISFLLTPVWTNLAQLSMLFNFELVWINSTLATIRPTTWNFTHVMAWYTEDNGIMYVTISGRLFIE